MERKLSTSTDVNDSTSGTFRLTVGEVGNERGHLVPTKARTLKGAKVALRRALAAYKGDGWGKISMDMTGDGAWCEVARTW